MSSLYKAFNLVVMEVLMLEFPHKMWWFIEMARMELRTTTLVSTPSAVHLWLWTLTGSEQDRVGLAGDVKSCGRLQM